VASIYSGAEGFLDRIKVERVGEFLQGLIERLRSEHKELMDGIDEGTDKLSEENETELKKGIADYLDDFGPDFDEDGEALEEGESDRIKSEEERSAPGRTAGENGGGEDADEAEASDQAEQEEEAGATA
jgi:F-type H+-transporting ATPase subunit alpha